MRVRTPPLRSKGAKKGKGKAGDEGGAKQEEGDEFFTVRLEQVQLEQVRPALPSPPLSLLSFEWSRLIREADGDAQDTAKSFHDPSLPSGPGTLVDLNRAGAALIEIVTKPDMRFVAPSLSLSQKLVDGIWLGDEGVRRKRRRSSRLCRVF